MTAAEEVYQGTWEHVRPEPSRRTVHETPNRGIVDIAAFRRLVKLLTKDVGPRIRAAEERRQKKAGA
jgi:hypothetical protein